MANLGVQNVKIAGNNLRENPLNTEIGQEVVSISENFWARLSREGRYRGNMWDAQAFSATSSWNWNPAWGHNAEVGYRMYIRRVVISTDVDCQVGWKIQQGVAGTTSTYQQMSAYLKAGTPWVTEFDGEYYLEDTTPSGQSGPGIFFGVNKAITGGNLYISVVGVEVTQNA